MNLKQRILDTKDHKLKERPVEEWGVSVWLKTWTARERLRVADWLTANEKRPDPLLAARILSVSLVEEDGSGIFSDKDLDELEKHNSQLLATLAKECIDWNAVGQEAAAKN